MVAAMNDIDRRRFIFWRVVEGDSFVVVAEKVGERGVMGALNVERAYQQESESFMRNAAHRLQLNWERINGLPANILGRLAMLTADDLRNIYQTCGADSVEALGFPNEPDLAEALLRVARHKPDRLGGNLPTSFLDLGLWKGKGWSFVGPAHREPSGH